jgi:hypothetical protein
MAKLSRVGAVTAAGFAAGLMAAIASAGSSAAAVQQVECGSTLSADTTLTSDLFCPGPGAALTLADGVTLDLGGHTLSGSGFAGVVGAAQGDSFAAKNSTISGFEFGVESGRDQQATVWNLRLLRNRNGAFAVDRGRVLISDSWVSHNGIGLSDTFGYFDVRNTYVSDNGIGLHGAFGGFTVHESVIAYNDDFGIQSQEQVPLTVVDSVVRDNGGFGIWVLTSYQDAFAVTLVGNEASRNGADGIYLSDPGVIFAPAQPWLVSHNTANDNHAYGIEVINNGGLISGYDKGGNVARGNGQPAQCLNIVCSSN